MYTFEKLVNENIWQARYKGEFICFVRQNNDFNFSCVDEPSIWDGSKGKVVDRVLNSMGYRNADDFLECNRTLL